jgi:peroxiredoxin
MLEEGQPAPGFTLPTDNGEEVSLESLRGKPIVLFYPKDESRSTKNSQLLRVEGSSAAKRDNRCP